MPSLSLVSWALKKPKILIFIVQVRFATLVGYPTLTWDVIWKIGDVESYFCSCHFSDRVLKIYYLDTHFHNVLIYMGHIFIVDIEMLC